MTRKTLVQWYMSITFFQKRRSVACLKITRDKTGLDFGNALSHFIQQCNDALSS